ncbi:MAG: peptide chain release factor N(5)-glutamine methyltransferase [Lachnospiraceae bacterium]|nr:peptide chain release factor N(5)-glutamine methyltransferase [Lachnospiraceae bacterium]
MTYAEAYEKGKNILTEAGIAEAGLEARLLLEHVCGTGRNDLLVHGDRLVEDVQCNSYEQLLTGRADRIPLQYLTGCQEFMGLNFAADRHVLIPRQDTEILVEEVLKNLHDGMEILDMCTGSGCILISLLRYSNDCAGLGVDISGGALRVAEKNAQNILSGFSGKVRFLESDLFENVEEMFDVIVSNPPYIPAGDMEGLMPEVRDYEPRIALDGGEDGLVFYRKILEGSRSHLKKGGMLFFEIGYDQGRAVSKMMRETGFLDVQVRKDYAGLDRVVFGTRSFA